MNRGLLVLVGLLGCTPLAPDDDLRVDEAERVAAAPEPSIPETFDPDACLDGDGYTPVAPPHADLALELQYLGPATIEDGESIAIRAVLINESDDETHHAVLPSDGSEVGWREPVISVSAQVEVSPGCWQPVAKRMVGRCGMFDEDWHKDIVAMKPGARRVLDPLWAHPEYMLDFSQAGRVRMQLHYAYTGGAAKGDQSSAVPRVLAGEAPYELVSNPVEFTVAQPLQLELTARAHAAGAPLKGLRDLVELKVTNTTSNARVLRWPTADTLRFESDSGYVQGTWDTTGRDERSLTLDPGQTLTLVGEKRFDEALEFAFAETPTQPVRLRAVLHPYADRPEARVASDWVEVDPR